LGRSSNYEVTGNVFVLFWHPSMKFNRNLLKIQIKIFELKIEKSKGVTLTFFFNFHSKNIFEFSGYYDCNLSRDTEKHKKRCQLRHNLIEGHENADVRCHSRRMS